MMRLWIRFKYNKTAKPPYPNGQKRPMHLIPRTSPIRGNTSCKQAVEKI